MGAPVGAHSRNVPPFAMVTTANARTIVVVHLDRSAILTNLVPLVETLIGEFGVRDGALFDVLTGRVRPTGRPPFELPRDMEAGSAPFVDVPHESEAPLYTLWYRSPKQGRIALWPRPASGIP